MVVIINELSKFWGQIFKVTNVHKDVWNSIVAYEVDYKGKKMAFAPSEVVEVRP
jgi:hypothetical protein